MAKLMKKKISDAEMLRLKLNRESTTTNTKMTVGNKYQAFSDNDCTGVEVKCTGNSPTIIKNMTK
jgi:hypothetical protein